MVIQMGTDNNRCTHTHRQIMFRHTCMHTHSHTHPCSGYCNYRVFTQSAPSSLLHNQRLSVSSHGAAIYRTHSGSDCVSSWFVCPPPPHLLSTTLLSLGGNVCIIRYTEIPCGPLMPPLLSPQWGAEFIWLPLPELFSIGLSAVRYAARLLPQLQLSLAFRPLKPPLLPLSLFRFLSLHASTPHLLSPFVFPAFFSSILVCSGIYTLFVKVRQAYLWNISYKHNPIALHKVQGSI